MSITPKQVAKGGLIGCAQVLVSRGPKPRPRNTPPPPISPPSHCQAVRGDSDREARVAGAGILSWCAFALS